MSESKHTPGPWTAIRNYAFWEVQPVNGGEEGIPFCVGDVCASEPGDPDSGRQEANARLIAAAPDLLEALKELRLEYHHILGTDSTKRQHAINARAEAAIAKAEGR